MVMIIRTLPRNPVEHAHSFSASSSRSPESLAAGSQTLPLKSSLKKVATARGRQHGDGSATAVGSMEELRV